MTGEQAPGAQPGGCAAPACPVCGVRLAPPLRLPLAEWVRDRARPALRRARRARQRAVHLAAAGRCDPASPASPYSAWLVRALE